MNDPASIPSPSLSPVLNAGEVVVHVIALDQPMVAVTRLERLLSDEEHARAARVPVEPLGRRLIVARGRLREVLAAHGAGSPERIRFHTGAHGKPAIDPPAHIRFNLSHSGELALLAVARDMEIGVDIEALAPQRADLGVARRFFSPVEYSALERLPAGERVAAFFRCWTRKEAFLKVSGDGLSRALDSFDVSVEAAGPSLLLATRPDAGEAGQVDLRSLEVGPGYVAAVAARGTITRIIVAQS